MEPLFHWFGGKRRIASEVWNALGSVDRYIEPFAGSAAVFLARKHIRGREVLNDVDGYLINFWRAVQDDAEGVAALLQSPISEVDLIARKRIFVERGGSIVQALQADPDYYHRKLAAWWFHGHCASVGNRWLRPNEIPNQFLPAMDSRPITDRVKELLAVQQRLTDVFLLCGEWQRTVGSDKVLFNGTSNVGVFLDPPYATEDRESSIYAQDDPLVAVSVKRWCVEHGDDPRLRIVLAGYAGEHDELEDLGWRRLSWVAQGGHGNRRKSGDNANRYLETLWCSPHCHGVNQISLFSFANEEPKASVLEGAG